MFVVDDENVIASTLELILIGHGFDVRSFVDPLDALNAARFASPDLLLTDVAMPNMNGIELAIQIKSECPSCEVLLLSGTVTKINLLAQADEHDFPFLRKPVDPAVLMIRIREALLRGTRLPA